jgi:hypothetical protein
MKRFYQIKNSILNITIYVIWTGLSSCNDATNGKHENTFANIVDTHLNAIGSRNLNELIPTIGDNVVMIGPEGDNLQSKINYIDFHKGWFNQPDWDWKYQILQKESSDSLGYVLVQYTFTQRDSLDSIRFTDEAYLILIFKNSIEGWQLVHDQNTRLKIN